jgi:hypothetical protein
MSLSIVLAGFQFRVFPQHRMTGFQADLPSGQRNAEAPKQLFVR